MAVKPTEESLTHPLTPTTARVVRRAAAVWWVGEPGLPKGEGDGEVEDDQGLFGDRATCDEGEAGVG